MNKLVTTAMVAVLGLFGAIDNGRVTLVSSASAQQPTASAKIAQIRAVLNVNRNNPEALRAALATLLAADPSSIGLLKFALNGQGLPQLVLQAIGSALVDTQRALLSNGNTENANSITQAVATLPPGVQTGYNAANQAVRNLGGQQGGNNLPPAQQPAAQQIPGGNGGSVKPIQASPN